MSVRSFIAAAIVAMFARTASAQTKLDQVLDARRAVFGTKEGWRMPPWGKQFMDIPEYVALDPEQTYGPLKPLVSEMFPRVFAGLLEAPVAGRRTVAVFFFDESGLQQVQLQPHEMKKASADDCWRWFATMRSDLIARHGFDQSDLKTCNSPAAPARTCQWVVSPNAITLEAATREDGSCETNLRYASDAFMTKQVKRRPDLLPPRPKQPSMLKTAMTADAFEAAGLSKLTGAELASLETWITAYAAKTSNPTRRAIYRSDATTQVVDAVSDSGDTFVIDGKVYKSILGCYGIYAGDRVVVAGASYTGSCFTATLVSVSDGKTCEVSCE